MSLQETLTAVATKAFPNRNSIEKKYGFSPDQTERRIGKAGTASIFRNDVWETSTIRFVPDAMPNLSIDLAFTENRLMPQQTFEKAILTCGNHKMTLSKSSSTDSLVAMENLMATDSHYPDLKNNLDETELRNFLNLLRTKDGRPVLLEINTINAKAGQDPSNPEETL
tara:strand:- start:29 stop:532 length:504 start_codon:yes stop_codon:yes gene_type:complete